MKGAVIFELSDDLATFVAGLDVLAAKNFPIEEVLAYLRLNPFDPSVLAPYRFFSETWYTRNLLYKAAGYELLLLCWAPHQESPIHGHEGEKCWMRVEEGSLEFTDYDVTEKDGELVIDPKVTVEGTVGFVDGPAVVHRVVNRTDLPASSLHLYAKPFAQCDIFDSKAHNKKRVGLKYFSVNGIVATEI
jgi:hypothetical protein